MAISFVETMRGFVTPHSGPSSALDFNVRAQRISGGRFELSGVVHAPPWVDEATCEGTFVMSALPASLAYDLRFRTADGRTLRLLGAKRPSPFAPIASLTVLPISLLDEGGLALAQGELRFDLFELPGFMASWLSLGSRSHRQLQARRVAVDRLQLWGGSQKPCR